MDVEFKFHTRMNGEIKEYDTLQQATDYLIKNFTSYAAIQMVSYKIR